MKIHKSLFGGGGKAVENRKRLNFWARFIISIALAGTFVVLLWLLFFASVQETSRDFLNVLLGAFVAGNAKAIDYWFKDKRDAEHEEKGGE